MENETNFVLGLRMGYFLAGLVSNYVESTCNEDLKPSQNGASASSDIISTFIESFIEFLQSPGKE